MHRFVKCLDFPLPRFYDFDEDRPKVEMGEGNALREQRYGKRLCIMVVVAKICSDGIKMSL